MKFTKSMIPIHSYFWLLPQIPTKLDPMPIPLSRIDVPDEDATQQDYHRQFSYKNKDDSKSKIALLKTRYGLRAECSVNIASLGN